MTDRKLFRVRAPYVLAIVLIGLLEAAALVAFTLLMRDLVHALTPTTVGAEADEAYARGMRRIGWMALMAVALGVLRVVEFGLAERAGYDVVRRLRMVMYQHMQGMTPDQLRHRARGGLLLRLTGDLSMLRMWVSRGLLLGTVALFNVVAGLAVVTYLNAWMGLAVVLTVALTALVSLSQGRLMRRATRDMRRHRSTLMGTIDEQLDGMLTVQVAGRTRGEYTRLSRQNEVLTRSLNRVAWLRGRLRGIAYGGSLLITVLVLGVGMVELRRGTTTVADVIAALLVVRFLSRPLRVLGLAHDYWQRGRVSRQKCQEFLTSRSRGFDHPERPRLQVRRGRIELQHVSAGRLQDLTATVERGQRVVITGPDGNGAEDLLRVLARVEDPEEGQVLIDDQPLLECDERSYLRQVGYVSPDAPLMRGSLRRNLTYMERDAEGIEMQRVAYSLGLDDVLERQGHDLGTWLTETGGNLTPGERQLLTVARALTGNPAILLLDQPMTYLDADSQRLVRETLAHHQGSVLQISHDPRDLAEADVVWHLGLDGSLTITEGRAHAVAPGAVARGAHAARPALSGAPAPALVGPARGGDR